MSFWQGLGRMIKGEPVFQPGDQHDPMKNHDPDHDTYIEGGDGIQLDRQPTIPAPEPASQTAAAKPDPYVAGGRKIVPDVFCERVEWHESGDHREIWATITNGSDAPVFLDKISLLGMQTELDYPLKPRQEREFSVYRGKKLDNRSYTKAQLYFRLENGDYFCADHQIFYDVRGDGENEVKELRLIRPIRDV